MSDPMRWIEANGLSLRVEAAGRGPATLVLLHELGGTLASFDALVPALAPACRVVRYDQRGAGGSEKPPGGFTLADHVADLAAILDREAGAVHLAGVAAGAAIAVAFALACPERVASLSLCAPALTVAPERRAYLAERADLARREGMRAVVEASLARSYPEALRGDAAAFARYRAQFLANDPVAYAHANRALADAELEDRLGALRRPCQVLAGQHDQLRPPDAVRAVAARIPGAHFHVLESGHIMPVQAPAAMAERLAGFVTDPRGAARAHGEG
jgi:3-oxoadipate enol-lactonase